MPLPLRRKVVPVWGALGHVVAHLAIQGGHLDVGAQGRLGKGDGHLAQHVGTVPLEEFMPPHGNRHQQIAAGTAVGAYIALAADTDALAVVDTGGNLHRQLLVPAGPCPLPLQVGQGFLRSCLCRRTGGRMSAA